MLFPFTRVWTRRQQGLIVGSAVLALALSAALIYGYERYYRGPSGAVFVGTWEARYVSDSAPYFFQFRSDHTFSVFARFEGALDPILKGRWYAGGPNIYLRFLDEDFEGQRPWVWQIVEIQAEEFRIRRLPDTQVITFRRAHLDAPSASNHSMERTGTRPGSTLALASALPLHATHAFGARRSSCSR